MVRDSIRSTTKQILKVLETDACGAKSMTKCVLVIPISA